MRGAGILVLLAVLVLSHGVTSVSAGGATRVPAAIWAHGELYGTVVTPTSFVAPPEHSADVICSAFCLVERPPSGYHGQLSWYDGRKDIWPDSSAKLAVKMRLPKRESSGLSLKTSRLFLGPGRDLTTPASSFSIGAGY